MIAPGMSEISWILNRKPETNLIAACVQPTPVEVVRCNLDILHSSVGLVASEEPFKVSARSLKIPS